MKAHSVCKEKVAQACAITFQGNVSNKIQQDAFFLLDNWYQEELGITEVVDINLTENTSFCFAVSDGVASSDQSQHCSKAVVKAIFNLIGNKQQITATAIQNQLIQIKHPIKRQGAAATLACLQGELSHYDTNKEVKIKATVTNVGDSRVYYLPKNDSQWQCLTRDHNLLNEMLYEQAKQQGIDTKLVDYNREGMASTLYAITEFFVLTPDEDSPKSQAPNSFNDTLMISAGDVLLLCTDGIHDLVSSKDWPTINRDTDLQQWLLNLKSQVYKSDGRAYDNGTAIIIRFL